jgi:Flp pilus assembly protein TadG
VRDEGSEVVEFTLVSVLVVFIVAGVLQLALTLHVRNTMISCAAAGARVAAAEDRSLVDGERRTEELIEAALEGYVVEVTATETSVDGAPAVEVSVTAPVPVVGLWGFGTMRVEARALVEVDRG